VSDPSDAELATLAPEVAERAFEMVVAFRQAGIPMRIISGRRSLLAQARLYAQGRVTAGPVVTNALTNSRHVQGRAFDIDFGTWTARMGDGHPLWNLAGEVGELLGLKWGGRWKSPVDRPHFEL